LFTEYYEDPERTASVHRGDWYLTGDRAYMDKDGYYWFVGRSDDIILSSGYRIGPFEVESAILEHPSVAESAVVSSPDDVRGEVVKAFIILKTNFKASEELLKDIQEYVKKATAPYKYPRLIEFVETLPKTVSGKIRRVELREKEWANYKRSSTEMKA
jgi:acyl-coenzyme A synthetase/AMP-(fatty) acid ligase